MQSLDKRLQATYSQAYKVAIENEKAAINKLASFDVEALKAQGLTDTQIRAKQLAFKAQVERDTKIANNIAAEITKSGETAAAMIQGEMLNVYGLNLDFSRFSIDKEAGVMFDWTIYDKKQINVLMTEKQSPFTKIAYKNLGKDKKIVQRLQNELTVSVINGESQQQIAKRISNVTGQSYKQARRVAQTERMRVQSQARSQGFDEASEMGVDMAKQWISRRDSKVRDDHAEVTGEIVNNDEAFSNGLMFPGDPDGDPGDIINCRCVLKPIVKNVPASVKAYREKMSQNYGFEEWRKSRGS